MQVSLQVGCPRVGCLHKPRRGASLTEGQAPPFTARGNCVPSTSGTSHPAQQLASYAIGNGSASTSRIESDAAELVGHTPMV